MRRGIAVNPPLLTGLRELEECCSFTPSDLEFIGAHRINNFARQSLRLLGREGHRGCRLYQPNSCWMV
jgi:hypothetical protein